MTIRTRAVFLAGLMVAVSCSDAGNPLGPPERTPHPAPEGALQTMECTVSVAAGTLSCVEPRPSTGAALGSGQIILGGQNVYVRLAASAFSVDADSIAFNVTLENLIGQALGTMDGIAPAPVDSGAVRIFFYQDLQSRNSNGDVIGAAGVGNPSGTDMFLGPQTPYFDYPQMIAPGAVSDPQRWKLTFAPGAASVTFRVFVWARIQHPLGWIDVAPEDPSIAPGASVQLTGTVYDHIGQNPYAATLTWESSDTAVATVDAAGLVTGVAFGSATISASANISSSKGNVVVTGSTTVNVNTPLLARDTTYQAIGNVEVPLSTAKGLANVVSDPDGETVSFVAGTLATAEGGSLALAADGSFQYVSRAGFVGRDSVQYTATDGTNTASAWVKLVSDRRFWFVAGGATNGTGTSAAPFGDLAGVDSATVANDTVLVRRGDGSTIEGGISLLNGQVLLGEGISTSLTATLNGDVVTLLAGLDDAPSIGRSTPGATLVLATGNVLRGLVISSSAGAAIQGTGFGTLTTGQLTVGATGPALLLEDGTLAGSFVVLSSTGSATRGLSLVNVAGTLAPAGGAIGGAASEGVFVSGGTVDVSYPGNVTNTAGRAIRVIGRTTGTVAFGGDITDSGSGTGILVDGNSGGTVQFSGTNSLSTVGNAAVTLTNNAGASIVFSGATDIVTSSGAALTASGGGTLAMTGAGSDITTGTGAALALNGVVVGASGIAFATVSTGAAVAPVSLVNVTVTAGSALTVGGGTVAAGAGARFAVDGGAVNVAWAGALQQAGNNAPLVSVSGAHAGTLTFSGSLSASSGEGLQFNGASGTYAFTGTAALNGGDAGVDIVNGSTGAFTFGTGTAITSPSGTAFNVYGSSPTVTYSGAITKANAGAMVEVGEQPGGSVTFQTGTLAASAGSGISLSNADGTVAFNGTTTLSGGASVAVVGGSAGTISFASGASVTNPTSAGLLVSASAPALTYAGSISSNAARPVQIEGMTGGTVAVSGSVTGTGNGILVQNNNAGSAKTITFSGAVNLNTGANEAVTLSNNTGATIGFTGGATDLSTTTGTAFAATGGGTVNVSGGSNDISTGTGSALLLNGVTLGVSGMSWATLGTGAAVAPVVLTNVGVTTGSQLSVAGGTIASGAGSRIAVSGGAVNLGWAGTVQQATASQRLLGVSGGHTGTLAFTGTLTATNGTGLGFDNADGTYNFTGTTTLNGGDAGVDVLNGSDGTFTFGSGTTITNPSGEVVAIHSSAPTFTYSGPFSKNSAGIGILLQNNTGGSVTFNGESVTKSLSTGGSNAISLVSNGSTSVSFTGGGLALSTTSGTALHGSSGGTVVVTGANNTVTSTGGVGINLVNTTIGGSGISLHSVNASGGGSNGIVLNNTGAGGFQVSGNGASDAGNTTRGRIGAAIGTGGTISGKSSHGISLTSTGAVTLRNMLIQNNSGDGISATTVNGLTVDNTRITGHTVRNGLLGTGVNNLTVIHSEMVSNATDDTGAGVSANDHMNMRMVSATGTASVRHSLFQVGAEHVARFFSTTGTLNLTVENNTFSGAVAGDGFDVFAFGSSNVTANVQGNTMQNNSAFGMDTGTETTQSASLNLTVNNNVFSNNFVGVTVAHGSSGTNTFNVTNNNFQNHGSISVNINRLGGGAFTSFGLFSGTVSGNTIGTAGTANSGSAAGSPIRVVTNGNGGTSRVSILNNSIREYAEHGITVIPRDANSGHTLHARIQSNSIANPHAFALDGINVTMGALNTDVISLCLDIGGAGGVGGNTVSNSPRTGVRVRSSGLPAANVTLTAPGYDGTGATYFANRNPAATGTGGNASFSNASGTSSAGNCTTP